MASLIWKKHTCAVPGCVKKLAIKSYQVKNMTIPRFRRNSAVAPVLRCVQKGSTSAPKVIKYSYMKTTSARQAS